MSQHVPGKALGKRKPSNKPALMLRDFLTGMIPATPIAADHFAQVGSWELGGNDKFGTCGPTSVANHLRLVSTYLNTSALRKVTTDDVWDLYRRSGNPGFNPSLASDDPKQEDNGVIVQEMLNALLAGGIGGNKPLAFAKIAAGDMDTLDIAIALFGGVILGLELQTAQQSQRTWNYRPTSDWGGHAVMAGRYTNPDGATEDRTAIITWAEVVDTTRSFVTRQEDEAWVVIWPEMVGSQGFLQGVDFDALSSAYQDLTGKAFPMPTVPTPSPTDLDPESTALEGCLTRFLRGTGAPRYLRTAAEAWLQKRSEQ